ncbi:hypothetical protein ANCCAN_00690 [Ancylostoma caninum]|uniref:Uncharacterized protein n=1 Tax=Ancylostoma caninum TaxID=29170 RepID=A0A368HCU2_ANCCA|nr:hypothetical protein ANCCAN_00690 [Ancylostoma caninum]
MQGLSVVLCFVSSVLICSAPAQDYDRDYSPPIVVRLMKPRRFHAPRRHERKMACQRCSPLKFENAEIDQVIELRIVKVWNIDLSTLQIGTNDPGGEFMFFCNDNSE